MNVDTIQLQYENFNADMYDATTVLKLIDNIDNRLYDIDKLDSSDLASIASALSAIIIKFGGRVFDEYEPTGV